MNVAVPLPKHSPRFGQLASSQTVLRLCSRRMRFNWATVGVPGKRARIQGGFFRRSPQLLGMDLSCPRESFCTACSGPYLLKLMPALVRSARLVDNCRPGVCHRKRCLSAQPGANIFHALLPVRERKPARAGRVGPTRHRSANAANAGRFSVNCLGDRLYRTLSRLSHGGLRPWRRRNGRALLWIRFQWVRS